MLKRGLGIAACGCGVLLVVGTYWVDGSMHAIPGLFLAFAAGGVAWHGIGDLGKI